MVMNPGDLHRYNVLTHLNQISDLTEQLHTQLTEADDWLFVSGRWGTKESSSCLQKASLCAAEARKTLETLEKQIRKTELVTDRMKDPE